ncbi:NlpC/P60 family protein [Dactylosporangium sp. NPDC051485]|uniref:C40 family peptidase n=1 Tax=Dactylosporangium sp. NPDC051485 TaxID=3154846 RepID=UPI00343C1F3E
MHRAGPGVELNARQPLHRIAAGTAALALYTVWLGPSAAAANPKPATAAVNADSGSATLTLAEQEILLTAYEKADRAHRVHLEPIAPVRPDGPVSPPAPAPPKTTSKPPATTATKKPATSTSKSTSPTKSGKSATVSKSSSTAGIAPPSGAAGTVVSFALDQVGKRYVYATAGPNTYDCSGLVMAAYAKVGIKLPHQSEQIAARGRRVPSGQWMPGDVIHMPGHVAIYIGNGKMVEAANPSAGVRVAPVRGGTAYRFL